MSATLGQDKKEGMLIDNDKKNDLALIKINGGNYQHAAFRADKVRVGEDIIVAGFPLTGFLSGMNITKGNVSALAGIEGNKDHIQISAPLQPGNSGSPILDLEGKIVGMAIGNADSKLVIDVYGDIPQNVNFGIGNGAIKQFLKNQKVYNESLDSAEALPVSAIADSVTHYTVLIECRDG